MLVGLQPVQPPHRLGSGQMTRSPHDTPAGFIEYQREHVCHSGRDRRLLPLCDLLAGAMNGDDRHEQRSAPRLRDVFVTGGAADIRTAVRYRRAGRGIRECLTEPIALLATQCDEPPRS
ncbi:MAG: hypothetical protein JWQ64_704 [Subtercola sp.]|nr:hypothetical protein [Subtercola sp.]